MATFSTTAPTTNASDAEFRKWGKAISDGFAAAGWVKAENNVNWATVLAPPGAGSHVYEVWRMADALQATSPVFLKVEYGEGTTTNAPQIWLTLGQATSGGTITVGTGQPATRHTLDATNGFTTSATETSIWISGTTSRIGIALWVGATAANGLIFVERAKTNNGSDNGEYTTLIRSTNLDFGYQFTMLQDGRGVAVDGYVGAVTTTASSIYNSAKGVSDIKPYLGKFGNPMTTVVGIKAADWSDGTTAVVPVYSSNITYRVVNAGIKTAAPPFATVITKAMMRWE